MKSRTVFPPLLWLALLLAPWAQSHAQEVYKTRDENGKVIFSDTPMNNSEKVDTTLKNLHSPTKAAKQSSDQNANKSTPPISYSLRLTMPQNSQQFGPTAKSITVNAVVTPELQEGDRISYFLNGNEVAQSYVAQPTSFDITRNMRGRNTISASVVNKNGKRLTSTTPRQFYVIRPN